MRISQFAADYVKNLASYLNDSRVPKLDIQNFGYMYLADSEEMVTTLRSNHAVQQAAGAATKLLSRNEIAAAYPFYALDDILLGSINTVDEGFFDGQAVFDWQRRISREAGVDYIAAEVTALTKNKAANRIQSVTLSTGQTLSCGQLVNATGPRAARTAAMAGISLPVEPRKRFTWVFRAEHPLEQPLPLTVDPCGVHVREVGGGTYMAGAHTEEDPAVAFDDFALDHGFWQDHVWPMIATRIPQFEAIKVISEWAGHYAYNTLDQNAITGPHPEISNFLFLNGFSGHGLQQSPAMGRGTAEWLTYGSYRSLDLSAFHYERVTRNAPIREQAVI